MFLGLLLLVFLRYILPRLIAVRGLGEKNSNTAKGFGFYRHPYLTYYLKSLQAIKKGKSNCSFTSEFE